MRLSNLLSYIQTEFSYNGPDPDILAVTSDSRNCTDGALFAAFAGSLHDGHDYIKQAIANGAACILAEREFEIDTAQIALIVAADARAIFAQICSQFWPARPDMVVGVTGTNGKTSTCQYLHQIWRKSAWAAASMGTLGITGLDGHISPSKDELTTQSAEYFFSAIAEQKAKGISHLAFEASSHGLAQNRLAGLGVNVAVFTNLTHDHLDFHGDMDSYFDAKAKLFDDTLLEGGTAIINIDDSYGRKLVKRLSGRHIVLWTVAKDRPADFRMSDFTLQPFGADITIDARGQSYHLAIALSGQPQAINAVMAAVAAHASGLPLQDSIGALPSLKAVHGRMEAVHGHPKGARIVVDYAHTPDALSQALNVLRDETSGKLSIVFGCGGDRDAEKRPQMGEIAARFCDAVFVTDDNPRSEDPALIRKAICSACPDADNIASRDDAIKQAIFALQAGDTLLIAGKGHEMTQTIGTESLPFDDRAQARAAISELVAKEAS